MDNVVKKYIWLITTIRNAGSLSFERINEQWMRSHLNHYSEPLSKKTFRNWIQSIADSFNIEIVCERKGGYKYHIKEDYGHDKWLSNYLDTLSIQASITEDDCLKDRIADYDRQYNPLLPKLAHYIKLRCATKIHVFLSFEKARLNPETADYVDIDHTYYNYYPLAILQVNMKWYLVGIFLSRTGKPWHKRISSYMVEHIAEIEIRDGVSAPDYPEDFSLNEYLKTLKFFDLCPGIYDHNDFLYMDLESNGII